MFLALTVSSILYHCTHGELIRKVDKIMAHIAFLMVVMDTPKAVEAGFHWVLIFPFITVCLWFGQSLAPSQKGELHFTLHLVAVVGMHLYLSALYPFALH